MDFVAREIVPTKYEGGYVSKMFVIFYQCLYCMDYNLLYRNYYFDFH